MSDVHVRLADPEGQLLAEIADPATTARSLVLTYAFALLDQDRVDWPKVNRAIIGRWSPAALDRIKRDAWRRVERKAAGQ